MEYSSYHARRVKRYFAITFVDLTINLNKLFSFSLWKITSVWRSCYWIVNVFAPRVLEDEIKKELTIDSSCRLPAAEECFLIGECVILMDNTDDL